MTSPTIRLANARSWSPLSIYNGEGRVGEFGIYNLLHKVEKGDPLESKGRKRVDEEI